MNLQRCCKGESYVGITQLCSLDFQFFQTNNESDTPEGVAGPPPSPPLDKLC